MKQIIKIISFCTLLIAPRIITMEQINPTQQINCVRVDQTATQEKIIILTSQEREKSPQYRIKSEAIKHSRMLNTLLEVSEVIPGTIIPIDYPDRQVHFIADLLNFLANNQHVPNNIIVQHIQNTTGNFTTITFADTLSIINHFDIPLAFTALTTIQQPLLLPRKPAECIVYNQQLAHVFHLANSTGEKSLWQLFGRMLYPGCLQHREVQDMINVITEAPGSGIPQSPEKKEIEIIILDAYMQQNPELYIYKIKRLNGHYFPDTDIDLGPYYIRSYDFLKETMQLCGYKSLHHALNIPKKQKCSVKYILKSIKDCLSEAFVCNLS